MRKLRYVGRYIIEDKTLGKGNFAVVELATHTITKTKVAIKVIDRHQIREEYVRQNLNREARILAQLRHPNVVRLYETISSSSLYCLVTEYAGGGDLLSFVRSQRDGHLRESDARPFVRQLVSALHHLHERGVVHRDLKMENIMMDSRNKNIKIVDFGLSNCFTADQLLCTHCGSPEYAAPELFTTETNYYGPEVDIWSMGINIYAMVCGKLPFTTPHSENRRKQLLKQLQYGLGPLQDKEMSRLSNECRDLLHQCIEPNPELRCPLLDIEVHAWITTNGTVPFYPYQQPRKDRDIKLNIIEKMARLLNVNTERIEGSIHEYRVDDVSAMYNILMDEYLSTKGYVDRDHTKGYEVKHPHGNKSVEDHHVGIVDRHNRTPVNSEEKPESTQQTAPKKVRLRTPTVIGMVRPSQTDPERWTLKSADFELRAIGKFEQTCRQRRPKTATFHQPSSKVKPMGNATTHNIMLARCNNFGNTGGGTPSFLQQHQKCRDFVNTNTHPTFNMFKESKSPIPAEQSDECDNHESAQRNNESEQEGQAPGIIKSPKVGVQEQPTPSQQLHSQWCENNCTHTITDELDESPKEVKVIDMVKYFNCKHGYQIRETPREAPAIYASLTDEDTVNPKSKSSGRTDTPEKSFKLCDDHREQVTSELTQSKDTVQAAQGKNTHDKKRAETSAVYRRATPYAGPKLRKEDESQPPATIEIKLPRNDEGYQSDSESETRSRSATPTQKSRWRPRFYQKSRRSASESPSPSPRYIHRADHRYCDECITASTPGQPAGRTTPNEEPEERPLFCTPVVSLQTTQDYVPYCIPIQQDDTVCTKEDTTKNSMPKRQHWQKQCVDTPHNIPVVKPKSDNGAKARELMKANSVHESYPQSGMRFCSAKLRTPPQKSSKPRTSHTAPPHPAYRKGAKGGKQKGAVHSSCKVPSSKTAFKMDKYSSGQCTPDEQAWTASTDTRNVIDLSKQHMLTLLQEASATLENATKLAERKKHQTQLHHYHYASHKREPIKPSWQKAIDQLKPHHYSTNPTAMNRYDFDRSIADTREMLSRPGTVRTLGKSRRSGVKSAGIAKHFGQRVIYDEGVHLNPCTGRPPPTVPPTSEASESVFNVDQSRDVQSAQVNPAGSDVKEGSVNYRLPKMPVETDQSPSRGWVNVGYFLERKLSNTLKGGDDITKMRKTPHSLNEVT